jgi:hypothetical protein
MLVCLIIKMRPINNKEDAIQKLVELLEDIKALNFQTAKFEPETDFIALDEDHQFVRGMKAWKLVEDWHLEEELMALKNRDYVLLHAPIGILPPRNPRRLLKMAAYHGKTEVVLHYFDILKLKDLPVVFRGLIQNRSSSDPAKLADPILGRFPHMDRAAAKIIVCDKQLIRLFYPAISHFGTKLYLWSRVDGVTTGHYSELAKLNCPASEKILYRAIKNFKSNCIKLLILAGAPITEKVQRAARKKYFHWDLLNEEQIRGMFAKYGIDPATLDDFFPEASFDNLIRKWLKLLYRGRLEGRYIGSSNYDKVFQVCLPRIAEAEPEIALQLVTKT